MNCPECNETIRDGQAFCKACGHSLKAPAIRKPRIRRKGSIAQREYQKANRNACLAIFIVGIMHIVSALFFYWLLDDPDTSRDSRARFQTFFIVDLSLGVLYVGMVYWAFKNTYAASLTAVILYIAKLLIYSLFNPLYILSGGTIAILIRITILIFLASGVKYGLAYRRFLEKKNAAEQRDHLPEDGSSM